VTETVVASVTVAHSIWGDARMEYLASLLGYANRYEAIGRLVNLWGVCTALGTDTPPPARIAACLGSTGAVEALLAADLGERLAGGTVRVKGCTGRIEWFADQRAAASPGGKARARTARRVNGRFAAAEPAPQAPAASPAAHQHDQRAGGSSTVVDQRTTSGDQQTPASGSVSGSDLSQTPPPARAIPVVEAPPVPAVPLEADSADRVKARRSLGDQVWSQHTALFASLQAAGVSRDAQPPAVHDPGRRELAERIREWEQEGGLELAAKRCQHVLAIGEAEARSKQTLRFLGGRLWQPAQVSNALPMSTSDFAAAGASAGRAGPRRAQQRDPSVGRAEPLAPHEYADGVLNLREIFRQ
jgi:hypothetical protein